MYPEQEGELELVGVGNARESSRLSELPPAQESRASGRARSPGAGTAGGPQAPAVGATGRGATADLHLPGLEPVTALDLLQTAGRARRRCGESGRRLAVLDGWSEFLASRMPPECEFVSPTFRDRFDTKGDLKPDPATPRSAFSKVHKTFRDLELGGPTFWVAEPHKWRETVHLHGVIRHLCASEHDRLFRLWVHRHGGIKILPANPGAIPYVLKYVFKQECCARHDWVDLSGLRILRGVEA